MSPAPVIHQSGSSSRNSEAFSQFYDLEFNHGSRLTQIIHSHPIYVANLLNVALHPNPGYSPVTFNLSQPAVLGQQNLLSINNERFPHPYLGNPFFIDAVKSLPLSHVTNDIELTASAQRQRIRLSDDNPIIEYIQRDILYVAQRQSYLTSRAPARPNTPDSYVVTDPVPAPPLYEDAPSYEAARAHNSRHVNAVIHQRSLRPDSSAPTISQIDLPPTIDNPNYVPSFAMLRLSTFEDLPLTIRPSFLLESILLYTAALSDPRILTFLIHPENTLDANFILDNSASTLILDVNLEKTPLPYLPSHWLKYHSNTTFQSLTHEFNFKCHVKFCPFNAVKYIDYFLSQKTIRRLTALAHSLSMKLYHHNHTLIYEYFLLVRRLSTSHHYLETRSNLFTRLYNELSLFFTESSLTYFFPPLESSPLGD